MSGAHETQPAISFSRIECGRGLERVVREDHLDFRRLNSAGDQHVEREVVRRRVLRQHQLLAAQVGGGLDVLAHHDAVAAVGEVDLLVDARHDPAFAGVALRIDEALEEQRHHIERGPADRNLAGRIGVAHRDRIVDQHQLDLELLAVAAPSIPVPALNPLLASTIGAQPAQTFSANRTVLFTSGLYAAMPLTGGSFSAGLKRYSLTVVGLAVSWLDSAGCATSLGSIFRLRASSTARGDRLGSDQIAAINRKSNQRKDNEPHGNIEAAFGLFGHGSRLRSQVRGEVLFILSSGRVFLYDRVLPGTLPFNEPPQVNRPARRFIGSVGSEHELTTPASRPRERTGRGGAAACG